MTFGTGNERQSRHAQSNQDRKHAKRSCHDLYLGKFSERKTHRPLILWKQKTAKPTNHKIFTWVHVMGFGVDIPLSSQHPVILLIIQTHVLINSFKTPKETAPLRLCNGIVSLKSLVSDPSWDYVMLMAPLRSQFAPQLPFDGDLSWICSGEWKMMRPKITGTFCITNNRTQKTSFHDVQ